MIITKKDQIPPEAMVMLRSLKAEMDEQAKPKRQSKAPSQGAMPCKPNGSRPDTRKTHAEASLSA